MQHVGRGVEVNSHKCKVQFEMPVDRCHSNLTCLPLTKRFSNIFFRIVFQAKHCPLSFSDWYALQQIKPKRIAAFCAAKFLFLFQKPLFCCCCYALELLLV